MTFQTRLILSIGIVLMTALVGLEYTTYNNTIRIGIENLRQQAEEVRGIMMSMRRVYQHEFLESDIELSEKTVRLLPAHTMNRISQDFLNWSQSGFTFNNVSTRPRNQLQAADEFESIAIRYFENNHASKLYFQPFINKKGEPFYLYARPIWVEEHCLKCHGKRKDAPEAIRNLYTTAFNLQVGDLRGILSIKLPATPLQKQAIQQVYSSLLLHFAGLLVMFMVVIILVRRYVAAPLEAITEGMQEVTNSNYQHELGQLKGEFAEPAAIFNNMRQTIVGQQDELNQRLLDLERATQAKDEFLATMSHELRTPLASILGYAELLKDKITDSEHLLLLENIHTSGQNQMALVNDILDMSKIESGKFFINDHPFSLTTLLDDIERIFTIQVREKGLAFTVQTKRHEEYLLQGDNQRIMQILINLIGNAIKFTDRGEVTLTADVVDEILQFEVSDTGVGIQSSNMEKLFQRFEQEDGSTCRRFGGTGLGLFISRNLADLMGGEVTARSEYGRGSTFILRVPYHPTEIKDRQESDQQQKSRTDEPALLTGHVLLAEDTPAMQLLIRRMVEKYGARVTAVDNGQMALEKTMDEAFDLILMDLQMPVMDGVEACKRIKESGVNTPVVALTANVLQKHKDAFFTAGCSGFIEKPIDRKLLHEALKRHLPTSSEG